MYVMLLDLLLHPEVMLIGLRDCLDSFQDDLRMSVLFS